MTAQKPGSAPCGLYLVLPENWTEPDFPKKIRDLFRAINASSYEKNNHIVEFRSDGNDYDEAQLEKIQVLGALTQSQGIIFIVGNDYKLARQCEADGVLLERVEDVGLAREHLGDDAIIGLRCGNSRRIAEQALNIGADYVSFQNTLGHYVDPGLVQWWHCKTDNPCLVEGRFTNDDCAFYVAAGADLMDASDYVWNHPDGVMQGIVNMNHAIDVASEQDARSVQ